VSRRRSVRCVTINSARHTHASRHSCPGALAITLASTAPAQQPPSDTTRVAVNRVFAAWSATDGPGCAVGVARDGQVVYENGYGMANLELDVPITPASIFHVASVSKQFTGMAIALLARDGKLSLDDDIRRYLPEIPNYGHQITIRHLLNHTSGLRDQWDLLYMARGGRRSTSCRERSTCTAAPATRSPARS
jgi:CubicO group peptidase (beta-lactamase class C family)